MRIIHVIKKETRELTRDRGFILTLVILPLILMLVFGYTFQADVKNMSTIVIDESNSEYSQEVINSINSSEYFKHEVMNISLEDAKDFLKRGKYRAVFYIPKDFDAKLNDAKRAEIKLYLDSSDYTIYNILKGASGGVMKDSLQEIVEILVEDLESERTEKQREVDQIQSLVDGLEEESENTINNLEKMDLDSALDSLDNLKDSLEVLKAAIPDPAVQTSIDDSIFEISDVRSEIVKQKNIVKETNATAHEIKKTYEDIQERLNHVHFELRALKKDFLSFPFDVENTYLFGEISYFQYLTPGIISLILFFIGFVLTSLNLVEERNSRTLFRISTTPLKKYELYGGKFFVYLFVGIIEAVYVLLIAMLFFSIKIVGSIGSVFLVLLLLMACAIGLGLLVSTVVKTMRQASLLLPLIVISLLLMSQTFSPVEVMPIFMRYVGYISPMFYSNTALRAIMIKGASFGDVKLQLIILAVYAVLALIIGILFSKKRIT